MQGGSDPKSFGNRKTFVRHRDGISGSFGYMIDVVLPVLNEAEAIPWVLGRLPGGFRPIVVDNGSNDGTGDLARAAGATVVREPRRGYGYACWAGVVAAEGADIVVLLDGDAADDPDDLPRVLGPVLDGEADLVIGSRALGTRDAGSMTPHPNRDSAGARDP